MNEMSINMHETIRVIVVTLGVAAVVIVIFLLIFSYAHTKTDRDGRIMQTCISSGGQWVQGNCIRGQMGQATQ